MKKNNLTAAGLESKWVQEIIKIAESLQFDYVVWEEVFNNGVKINENTIVEVSHLYFLFNPPTSIDATSADADENIFCFLALSFLRRT